MKQSFLLLILTLIIGCSSVAWGTRRLLGSTPRRQVPRWHPSGRWVVTQDGLIEFGPGGQARFLNPTILLKHPGAWMFGADWLGSATRLVVATSEPKLLRVNWDPKKKQPDVVELLNRTGSKIEGAFLAPAVSPNRNTIAFLSAPNDSDPRSDSFHYQLCVMRGSGARVLTPLPLTGAGPRWSPSGKFILVNLSGSVAGYREIGPAIVDAVSGSVLPISKYYHVDIDQTACWGRDDNELILGSSSDYDRRSGTILFDLRRRTTKKSFKTLSSGAIPTRNPALDRTGRYVAVVEEGVGEAVNPSDQVVVVDLSTGKLSSIYRSYRIGSPQWSPDGRWLVFTAMNSDETKAWTFVPVKNGRRDVTRKRVTLRAERYSVF
jgi:dipeptidyl aminopeptidase/acylaminoacyl peptidase